MELQTWLEALGEAHEQTPHPIDPNHWNSSCAMVRSTIGEVDDRRGGRCLQPGTT